MTLPPGTLLGVYEIRSLDANPSILEMLGGTYAAWGRKDDARKILAELTARASEQYVCPFEVATVHAALGDRKSTLEWAREGLSGAGGLHALGPFGPETGRFAGLSGVR